MAGAALGGVCGELLDYKTAKFVLTRNRRVGLLHRLLQLGVLGYLLGWVLLVRKGYQDTDRAPRAAVVTKLKGAAVAAAGGADRRLWDAADYGRPPQGENVLFLVTNFIATARQAQGSCAESPSVLDAKCTEDGDCPMGNPVVHGNGIKTGKCVMFNTTHSTCEIYGWCPVENSTLPRKPLLAEAENFTLFIKNTVHFTKFNFSKCNTLQTNDPTYFKSCTYDPFFNPSCPVFRVRDMVEATGETFGDLALLCFAGGEHRSSHQVGLQPGSPRCLVPAAVLLQPAGQENCLLLLGLPAAALPEPAEALRHPLRHLCARPGWEVQHNSYCRQLRHRHRALWCCHGGLRPGSALPGCEG
ncbi:P2X purinoceptor 6 isoform X5 [Balearica regulorum gibbericeps]|uniref:P2X purinoceptor 6 isoform X5 n=1 Tax=Balearica regulorum gibbericeps TaxID=100784 RepID=UPI003F62F9FD